MWSPLLKMLDYVGKPSVTSALLRLSRRALTPVGNVKALDAANTYDWRKYLDPRTLSRTWEPHSHGPWTPFHCVTLFAALDYLNREHVGPCGAPPLSLNTFRVPDWIDSATFLLVDLPGPKSVALGAVLGASGCDLVCTFNNWPQARGVIRPEDTLAALLYYASWLDAHRDAYPTPGPAAWLCDSGRLGAAPGKPGDFDNRYYIEDGVIPGPEFLRQRGITRAVYVAERPDSVMADLAPHLLAYQKAGLEVGQALSGEETILSDMQPLLVKEQVFSQKGFFRSTAGGFGAVVPTPSSGGSGG